MIFKTAIIDDSSSDLFRIQEVLTSAGSDLCFDISLFESYSLCKSVNHFNLFILDIDLPERNGFDIAMDIQNKNPSAKIMFCSCHNDLVFDSLRLNSIFFIRKSRLDEDIKEALKKLQYCIRDDYYLLTFNRKTEKIPVKKIVYAESVKNNIIIFTADGKEHIERKAMKQLMADLPMSTFLQISAGCIVNIRYVTEIKNKQIFVQDSKSFSIPSTRIQQIKKELGLRKLRYGMF